ncbi:hypothetical protein BURMUCGD2M_5774 [Burkholderia multivorans CGD2M]|uniref:Uncharacterized protein n=1 Tax=Burkholderia multivorans CGD2 TaxID=513052 RepID=B9BL26_9BURK|nr:hypothetical protein BURMUCGD2_5785 [Burkholderia multivorans CGD2]EEE16328.1 hypothetical protein BURMUCGD2M_5774 [Burkholderia multivorans CGD2M]
MRRQLASRSLAARRRNATKTTCRAQQGRYARLLASNRVKARAA